MSDRPRIRVRISGKDVAPETYSASDLAEILRDFDKMIVADDRVSSDSDVVVSLVGIEEGSALLTLAVNPTKMPLVRTITAAIETGDFREVPLSSRHSLYEVSKKAVKSGRSFEIDSPGDPAVRRVSISPDRPIPEIAESVISGSTEMGGELFRIGGSNSPTAHLRLLSGDILVVSLKKQGREFAKRLCEHLYRYVTLQGQATWRVKDRSIEAFEAEKLVSASDLPPMVSGLLEALAGVHGGEWDGVDAVEYVREARSEG